MEYIPRGWIADAHCILDQRPNVTFESREETRDFAESRGPVRKKASQNQTPAASID
jgi:hypothetical protein